MPTCVEHVEALHFWIDAQDDVSFLEPRFDTGTTKLEDDRSIVIILKKKFNKKIKKKKKRRRKKKRLVSRGVALV